MNGLDLFSGIGGMSEGLSSYVRPVAYCEIDEFSRNVLFSRMQKKELANAPIWDDIRTLPTEQLPELDIIYGGFPCQDISCAGSGKGLDGDRSKLFYQIIEIAKKTKPKFIFLENVPAIRTRGLFTILKTFTELGYDCRWTVLSAAEFGIPQIRKRWFLLAYSKCSKSRIQSRWSPRPNWKKTTNNMDCSWWITEPSMDRVVNGIPNQCDRIKALGNSVIPFVVKTAFERLIGINNE